MAKKPAKKSISKKKEDQKKKQPAKKAAAKKNAKKATASKAKAPSKPRKTAASKPKAAKRKKAASKKEPPKKLSVRDLILKKIEKLGPENVIPFERPKPVRLSAPPLISASDKKEAARIRTLLLKKFDYADLVAAAEKAAAQKAAAEKAAAEKAAAEKAAAQKAAAEKAAAEKAAAERVTVTYNADDEGGDETMDKTTKILAAAVIGVLLLIAAASMSNTGNYYLKPTDKALEIWRGKFAPKGEKLFVKLPGVKAPESIKSVYTKKDVFPLVFNHHITQADALLSDRQVPDFAAIKLHLEEATPFAVTPPLKEAITARLTALDLMVLMYKAEASATGRTEAGLKKALGYLQETAALPLTDGQKALVKEKKTAIEGSLAAMRQAKARKADAARKVNTPKKAASQHSPS